MIRTTGTAIGLAIAMMAIPAIAQPIETFANLDLNRDSVLIEAEFEYLGRRIFAIWDRDENRSIDEIEFFAGVFDLWDTDRDGAISLSEYDDGWSIWFSARNYVGYEDEDINGDGVLSAREFSDALIGTGLFGLWTYGGRLDEDKFAASLFRTYDTDNDSLISKVEFDEISHRLTPLASFAANFE